MLVDLRGWTSSGAPFLARPFPFVPAAATASDVRRSACSGSLNAAAAWSCKDIQRTPNSIRACTPPLHGSGANTPFPPLYVATPIQSGATECSPARQKPADAWVTGSLALQVHDLVPPFVAALRSAHRPSCAPHRAGSQAVSVDCSPPANHGR